jgi:RNA polymerase sigma factor (TIGR02999 family)
MTTDQTPAIPWPEGQGASLPAATDAAFGALYADLRRLAGAHMRRESAGHTLSATALLHEAWFRMAAQHSTEWKNRAHFLAMASTMMRRILVSHALAKQADKRDAELVPLTLSEAGHLGVAQAPDVVAVHEALLAFAAVDARAARVVELRFFGGLTNDEVAEVLGVSLATVKRDWDLARAWLRRELAQG